MLLDGGQAMRSMGQWSGKELPLQRVNWKDKKAEVKEQDFKREISRSDVVYGVAVERVAVREWRIRLLGWSVSRNGKAKLLGGLPR